MLARWSGWGAAAAALDPTKTEYAKVREELATLLDEKELAAAQRTVLNAHYTDVALVREIWDAVAQLGFTGGQVIEPGCGSGNFIALAPDSAEMTGVELDPTTAAIAQAIHPHATILAESFAKTQIRTASMDLAIGNVPFGDARLHDPTDNRGNHSIHNHFILKSLRAVRPGGLVAAITSAYTMDASNPAARREMQQMADLLGAVRLPSKAHARAAGTDALTDVLIFRRREDDQEPAPFDWETSGSVDVDGVSLRVNDYFLSHPERVLGRITPGGPYREDGVSVIGDPTAAPEQLREALATITAAAQQAGLVMTPSATLSAPRPAARLSRTARRPDGYLRANDDGSFSRLDDGEWETYDVFKSQATELRALLGLRDTAVALLEAEAASLDDTDEIFQLRQRLNNRYDAYKSTYGPVNRFTDKPVRRKDPVTGRMVPAVDEETGEPLQRRERPRAGGFRHDPFAPVVRALEVFDEETQTAAKTEIFQRRVVLPRPPRLGADTAVDALAISLDEYGEVRLDKIAWLLGTTEDEARAALGTKVFDDPASGRLVHAPEYLSGDVKTKLAVARVAADDDDRYAVNVTALTEVVPPDLGPEEITIKMGAPWIDATYIRQFLTEILEDPTIKVEHGGGAMWTVESQQNHTVAATSIWGTSRRSADEVAQHILEQRPFVIKDTIGSGPDKREVVNVEAIMEATEKAEQMRERFADWVWENDERAAALVATYNEIFQRYVLRSYDGTARSLPGLAMTFKPDKHQLDAVERIIHEPAVGLYHAVGAGKTATMIMGTMELRRLGLAKKPVIVVPNQLLDQWTREFLRLYPQAKLLAASTEDLNKDRRKLMVARMATGDWDAVILTESAFTMLPMSPEAQQAYMGKEMAALRDRIDRARGEGKEMTLKRLEAQLLKRESKLEAKLDNAKDDGIWWELCGIDLIARDESHRDKNLHTASNVPGMSIPGSQRAQQMDMKVAWLREHGRSHWSIRATGTPIANSLVELYTEFRYLRPDLMEAQGITDIDSFLATYTQGKTVIEVTPDGGGLRNVVRLEYFNFPDLLTPMRVFADVKTKNDLNLPRPMLAQRPDGERTPEIVTVEPSPELLAKVAELVARAKEVKGKRPEKGADNILKIVGEGTAAALALELLGLSTDAQQKLDVAAEMIAGIYHANLDRVYLRPDGRPYPITGSFQGAFCDLGTPSDTDPGRWTAYGYLRARLAQLHVPVEKVRFIHEAKDDRQRAEMFAACRDGRIAVLIGSTEKMGTGVNVQDRMLALHHLDCPWRPCDLEQRDGRIDRRGNQNPEIRILRYVTPRSLDAFRWQKVAHKARIIDQVMSGTIGRSPIEDVSAETITYEQMMAAASGNPLMEEHAKTKAELVRLTKLESGYLRNQQQLRYKQKSERQAIVIDEATIAEVDAAIARRVDTKDQAFTMTIRDRTYIKRTEANASLKSALGLLVDRTTHWGKVVDVGQFGGFTITAEPKILFSSGGSAYTAVQIALAGAPGTDINLAAGELNSVNLITRMENRLAGLEEVKAASIAEIPRREAEIRRAEENLQKPFRHADALAEVKHRFQELDSQVIALAAAEASAEAAGERAAGQPAQEPAETVDQPTRSDPPVATAAPSTSVYSNRTATPAHPANPAPSAPPAPPAPDGEQLLAEVDLTGPQHQWLAEELAGLATDPDVRPFACNNDYVRVRDLLVEAVASLLAGASDGHGEAIAGRYFGDADFQATLDNAASRVLYQLARKPRADEDITRSAATTMPPAAPAPKAAASADKRATGANSPTATDEHAAASEGPQHDQQKPTPAPLPVHSPDEVPTWIGLPRNERAHRLGIVNDVSKDDFGKVAARAQNTLITELRGLLDSPIWQDRATARRALQRWSIEPEPSYTAGQRQALEVLTHEGSAYWRPDVDRVTFFGQLSAAEFLDLPAEFQDHIKADLTEIASSGETQTVRGSNGISVTGDTDHVVMARSLLRRLQDGPPNDGHSNAHLVGQMVSRTQLNPGDQVRYNQRGFTVDHVGLDGEVYLTGGTTLSTRTPAYRLLAASPETSTTSVQQAETTASPDAQASTLRPPRAPSAAGGPAAPTREAQILTRPGGVDEPIDSEEQHAAAAEPHEDHPDLTGQAADGEPHPAAASPGTSATANADSVEDERAAAALPTWLAGIQVIDGPPPMVRGTTGHPREEPLRVLLKAHGFEWRVNAWCPRSSRGRNSRYSKPSPERLAAGIDAARRWLVEQAAKETMRVVTPVKSYPPTGQQQAIIDVVAAGKDVVVQALAGTGKTSTLVMLAADHPDKRIVYIAFNNSIAKEARGKFGPNVRAETSHAFAREGLAGGPLQSKLDRIGKGLRWPDEWATHLNITPFSHRDDMLGPAAIARLVQATVRAYRQSAAESLTAAHLPHHLMPGLPGLGRKIVEYAAAAWADIRDPAGKLLFDHDDYLKIWALGHPRLPADLIFFDEAQDINDVLRQVIQEQPTQTIVVGDSNQSIYGFRGAVDALRRWPADAVLPLTKSWRFGEPIAEVGNQFLRLLRSPWLLEGNAAITSTVGQIAKPDAVLVRSNAGAVTEVFTALDKGLKAALIGGGRVIEEMAQAAKNLQAGKTTNHPELSRFKNWEDVVAFCDDPENEYDARPLRPFVRLVEERTADALIKMIKDLVKEDATRANGDPAYDLIISTVHKSKGLEWDHVRIGDDFHQPEENLSTGRLTLPEDEELRLAYVAVTRAKRSLQPGSLRWITELDAGQVADLVRQQLAARGETSPEPGEVEDAVPHPQEHPAPVAAATLPRPAPPTQAEPTRTPDRKAADPGARPTGSDDPADSEDMQPSRTRPSHRPSPDAQQPEPVGSTADEMAESVTSAPTLAESADHTSAMPSATAAASPVAAPLAASEVHAAAVEILIDWGNHTDQQIDWALGAIACGPGSYSSGENTAALMSGGTPTRGPSYRINDPLRVASDNSGVALYDHRSAGTGATFDLVARSWQQIGATLPPGLAADLIAAQQAYQMAHDEWETGRAASLPRRSRPARVAGNASGPESADPQIPWHLHTRELEAHEELGRVAAQIWAAAAPPAEPRARTAANTRLADQRQGHDVVRALAGGEPLNRANGAHGPLSHLKQSIDRLNGVEWWIAPDDLAETMDLIAGMSGAGTPPRMVLTAAVRLTARAGDVLEGALPYGHTDVPDELFAVYGSAKNIAQDLVATARMADQWRQLFGEAAPELEDAPDLFRTHPIRDAQESRPTPDREAPVNGAAASAAQEAPEATITSTSTATDLAAAQSLRNRIQHDVADARPATGGAAGVAADRRRLDEAASKYTMANTRRFGDDGALVSGPDKGLGTIHSNTDGTWSASIGNPIRRERTSEIGRDYSSPEAAHQAIVDRANENARQDVVGDIRREAHDRAGKENPQGKAAYEQIGSIRSGSPYVQSDRRATALAAMSDAELGHAADYARTVALDADARGATLSKTQGPAQEIHAAALQRGVGDKKILDALRRRTPEPAAGEVEQPAPAAVRSPAVESAAAALNNLEGQLGQDAPQTAARIRHLSKGLAAGTVDSATVANHISAIRNALWNNSEVDGVGRGASKKDIDTSLARIENELRSRDTEQMDVRAGVKASERATAAAAVEGVDTPTLAVAGLSSSYDPATGTHTITDRDGNTATLTAEEVGEIISHTLVVVGVENGRPQVSGASANMAVYAQARRGIRPGARVEFDGGTGEVTGVTDRAITIRGDDGETYSVGRGTYGHDRVKPARDEPAKAAVGGSGEDLIARADAAERDGAAAAAAEHDLPASHRLPYAAGQLARAQVMHEHAKTRADAARRAAEDHDAVLAQAEAAADAYVAQVAARSPEFAAEARRRADTKLADPRREAEQLRHDAGRAEAKLHKPASDLAARQADHAREIERREQYKQSPAGNIEARLRARGLTRDDSAPGSAGLPRFVRAQIEEVRHELENPDLTPRQRTGLQEMVANNERWLSAHGGQNPKPTPATLSAAELAAAQKKVLDELDADRRHVDGGHDTAREKAAVEQAVRHDITTAVAAPLLEDPTTERLATAYGQARHHATTSRRHRDSQIAIHEFLRGVAEDVNRPVAEREAARRLLLDATNEHHERILATAEAAGQRAGDLAADVATLREVSHAAWSPVDVAGDLAAAVADADADYRAGADGDDRVYTALRGKDAYAATLNRARTMRWMADNTETNATAAEQAVTTARTEEGRQALQALADMCRRDATNARDAADTAQATHEEAAAELALQVDAVKARYGILDPQPEHQPTDDDLIRACIDACPFPQWVYPQHRDGEAPDTKISINTAHGFLIMPIRRDGIAIERINGEIINRWGNRHPTYETLVTAGWDKVWQVMGWAEDREVLGIGEQHATHNLAQDEDAKAAHGTADTQASPATEVPPAAAVAASVVADPATTEPTLPLDRSAALAMAGGTPLNGRAGLRGPLRSVRNAVNALSRIPGWKAPRELAATIDLVKVMTADPRPGPSTLRYVAPQTILAAVVQLKTQVTDVLKGLGPGHNKATNQLLTIQNNASLVAEMLVATALRAGRWQRIFNEEPPDLRMVPIDGAATPRPVVDARSPEVSASAQPADPIVAPASAVAAGKAKVSNQPAATADAPKAQAQPSSPTTPVTATEHIHTAYATVLADVGKKPGDFVPIAAVRDRLPDGLPRAAVDAELARMGHTEGYRVIPVADRKNLTPADHEAAVRIGDEDNHALAIAAATLTGKRSPAAQQPAPEASRTAAATPQKIGPKTKLTLTSTRDDGTTRVVENQTLRTAGQQVAFHAHDNMGLPRAKATEHGMAAERAFREGQPYTAGNRTFTVAPAGAAEPNTARPDLDLHVSPAPQAEQRTTSAEPPHPSADAAPASAATGDEPVPVNDAQVAAVTWAATAPASNPDRSDHDRVEAYGYLTRADFFGLQDDQQAAIRADLARIAATAPASRPGRGSNLSPTGLGGWVFSATQILKAIEDQPRPPLSNVRPGEEVYVRDLSLGDQIEIGKAPATVVRIGLNGDVTLDTGKILYAPDSRWTLIKPAGDSSGRAHATAASDAHTAAAAGAEDWQLAPDVLADVQRRRRSVREAQILLLVHDRGPAFKRVAGEASVARYVAETAKLTPQEWNELAARLAADKSLIPDQEVDWQAAEASNKATAKDAYVGAGREYEAGNYLAALDLLDRGEVHHPAYPPGAAPVTWDELRALVRRKAHEVTQHGPAASSRARPAKQPGDGDDRVTTTAARNNAVPQVATGRQEAPVAHRSGQLPGSIQPTSAAVDTPPAHDAVDARMLARFPGGTPYASRVALHPRLESLKASAVALCRLSGWDSLVIGNAGRHLGEAIGKLGGLSMHSSLAELRAAVVDVARLTSAPSGLLEGVPEVYRPELNSHLVAVSLVCGSMAANLLATEWATPAGKPVPGQRAGTGMPAAGPSQAVALARQATASHRHPADAAAGGATVSGGHGKAADRITAATIAGRGFAPPSRGQNGGGPTAAEAPDTGQARTPARTPTRLI